MLVNSSAGICGQESYGASICGFPESSSSQILLRYFEDKSGWEVVFYGLNDSSSLERFLDILKTLKAQDIEALPSELCLQCKLKEHFTLENVWIAHASPIVGFFHDERLTAMTIGVIDHDVLDEALLVSNTDYVKIFTKYNVDSLGDEGIRDQLEELFLNREKGERAEVNPSNIVLSIALLALADSVNPCTFAVFTALLLMTLYLIGKMKTAFTGFFLILAVFIGYYALGLGFFQILTVIPHVDKLIAVVGLMIGAFGIARGLKPEFKSPVPKSFRKFMEFMLSKSYASHVASFFLGLAASFTLLPCSSGPYLIGSGLLSTLQEPIRVFTLPVLYNIIFVTPLTIILISVLAFDSLSRKVEAFRSIRLGLLELVRGSLLVAACIYILLS